MYVIATFKQSNILELCITELEEKGIHRSRILAVPMVKRKANQQLFDSIYRADGISLFDGMAAMGTVFMTLGTIYGYVWTGGPILWGLIGLLVGGILGFVLDLFIGKKRIHKVNSGDRGADVVLMIHCEENQVPMIEKVLWDHLALGVATVDRKNKKSCPED